MSRVVYLHIGAPKTGTTYLQDRLMLNQSSLADHGVTIPTKNRFVDADLFHFRAALDLLEQDWGGAPGHAAGRVGHDGQAGTPRLAAPSSSATRSSPRPSRTRSPGS